MWHMVRLFRERQKCARASCTPNKQYEWTYDKISWVDATQQALHGRHCTLKELMILDVIQA